MVQEDKNQELKLTNRQQIVYGAVIILIVFIISVINLFSEDKKITNPEEYFKNNTSTAKMMCREGIKMQLKAPSTAEFNLYNVLYTGAEGAEGTVGGYVDAQNSFGVKIRTNLDCKFRWTGSDFQLKEANLHF